MEKQEIITELQRLKPVEVMEIITERERRYTRKLIKVGLKKGIWTRGDVARLLNLTPSAITKILRKAR